MVEQTVTITDDHTTLGGFLEIPSVPTGIVLFAHGSGSGRFSPRNRFVARQLQQGGIATLLIDLLMTDEEEDRRNVFEIDLLSDRVLIGECLAPRRLSYQGAAIGLLRCQHRRGIRSPSGCTSFFRRQCHRVARWAS